MGFFSGILGSAPIEFANILLDKIEQQFPSKVEGNLVKKGVQRRLESVLENVMQELISFQKKNKLGWIGKARLGNAVHWGLRDRGYSKEFSEAVTESIVKTISAVK